MKGLSFWFFILVKFTKNKKQERKALTLMSCFCSEFIESKQKKGRRNILGGGVKMGTLAWQLNVRFNKLAAKTRHQN